MIAAGGDYRLLEARRSRVAVLGAGGWFGRTLLDVLATSGEPQDVLGMTRRPRTVSVHGQAVRLGPWDAERLKAWQPDYVVNCAYLTRERELRLGRSQYVSENTELTRRFVESLSLPGLRGGMTISSGAATRDLESTANVYGRLKHEEETLTRAAGESAGIPVVVCRAWSVSGKHVREPGSYAFSSIVLGALRGSVLLHSGHPVFRRYVSVEDLLSVCLTLLMQGWSGTIDSGGPLIELGDLADEAVAVINPAASIMRADADGLAADRYYADEASWVDGCAKAQVTAAGLADQLRSVAEGLVARGLA
jgi:nucleoside-diphosphate-sugar epimerase